MVSRLAAFGGPRTVPRDAGHVEWPVVNEADERVVLRVLRSGRLVADAQGEAEVSAFEEAWASYVGVRYCAAVSSGTAALEVALAALGIGPGDEVIVPALTFSATALAALQLQAVPVFVDVTPATFTLDPGRLEAAISPCTRAIVPVHLHGLPADMDPILAIARRYGLAVVEDAAQAHGATYHGRQVGALGTVGCFSLHPSKNLPACGEGGLVTTDDSELHERVAMRRAFGESPRREPVRSYVSYTAGSNLKLSPIQAAFARSQLERFEAYAVQRERNVVKFLSRLAKLPGLTVPGCPPDRTHAWHILRFRVNAAVPVLAGLRPAAVRQALYRVLRAEGVPVSRYQVLPLPGQPVFQRQAVGRADEGTLAANAGPDPRHSLDRFPVAQAVVEDSLCLQKRHLNPGSGPLLDRYAEAFEKVWDNLEDVARLARPLSRRMAEDALVAAPT
jgi:dTDP-4-amino-4,6-dideoxygalactose transaminase